MNKVCRLTIAVALIFTGCDSTAPPRHVPVVLVDDLISGMTISEVTEVRAKEQVEWDESGLLGEGDAGDFDQMKGVVLARNFRVLGVEGEMELGFGDGLLYSALFSPNNSSELFDAYEESLGRAVVPGERVFSNGTLCLVGEPIPKFPRGFLWCRDVRLDARFNESTDTERYLDRLEAR